MNRFIVFATILFASFCFGQEEGQNEEIYIRGRVTYGSWQADFRQSGFNQSKLVEKNDYTSALGGNIGVAVSHFPIFFEVQGIQYFENYPRSTSFDECQYTEYGFNIGYTNRSFPVEPYVGIGAGTYVFENVHPIAFFGTSKLAGLTFLINPRDQIKYGLRLEYRNVFFERDSHGIINSKFRTTANIFSVGAVIGL